MRFSLKYNIFYFFVLTGLLSYCVGGCLIVSERDVYESIYEDIEMQGEFVPSIWHSSNINSQNFIFWRSVSYDLPHKIEIQHNDQSVFVSHKGFEKFRIDLLTIEYSDGTEDILINSSTQSSSRTYSVNNEVTYINNAIQKRMDFILICTGVSVKESGDEVAFSRKHKYEYRGRVKDVYTIFDVWASV